MSNFGRLYKAELKKILAKKALWVGMAIGLAFVLVIGLVDVSSDGHSEYLKEQQQTLGAISGRVMDQGFFEEFAQDVQAEMENNWSQYEKLNAYNPGTAYMNAANAIGKRALYDQIYNVIRDRDKVPGTTAEQYYTAMRENIIHDGKEMGASEEEIDAWLVSYDEIKLPMTYNYSLGYMIILDVIFVLGWVLILNISIALAGSYADEKVYRTDAMILSTRNGRLPICLAKILAGITVAVGQVAVLMGAAFAFVLSFYGTSGWGASIQNIIPSSPWNITIGTMVVILCGLAAGISIVFAMFNMLLSHVTHSAIGTMAINAGIIFAGLFNVPSNMGIISKLWQLKPTLALYYGSFCNAFRYGNLNNVEISFIIYGAATVIMAALLILSYRKTQVQSR